jgi:FtsH-binding integral membrane protein
VRLPDNPFPEPYTVPDCVDDQSYAVKVRFIKLTLVGHLATILVIALSAQYLTVPLSDLQLLVVLGVILVGMTLVRLILRTGPAEQALSLVALVAALPFLAQLAKDIHSAGYPILTLLIAAAFTGIYTMLAGRDFSFTGMVTITAVALIPTLMILRWQGVESFEAAAFGWLIGTIYVLYIAYNLSMILKRRRKTEVVSAVADFYRDSLNILTYPVRIYFHWKHYKFQ